MKEELEAAIEETREALMLDVKLANGEIVSWPYSSLREVQYQSKGVIRLRFDSDQVTVEGTNLLPLHKAIVGHWQRSIEENTVVKRGPRDKDAVQIGRIEITES